MKYFNLISAPRRLQMTKDRLFLMSVVIYFNRVSVLQPIFDRELMSLTDSGLIQYWVREYIDDRSQSKRYVQQVPKKLKPENVIAIFEICAGLLAFCFLVFVLEKLSERFISLKTVVDNITY